MFSAPSHQKLRWVFGLVALLVFQGVGWYFAWGVLAVEARISAEQNFSSPQGTLQHFTLSAADLSRLWVDKREIRLEGHLYDVCLQVPHGDSVYLRVYHDQPEEALLSTLQSILAADHSTTMPLCVWLLQWMAGVYLLPLPPVLPQRPDAYAAGYFRYRPLIAQYQPTQRGLPPKS